MPIITLFEHQTRSYADLGWDLNHPAPERLGRLNDAFSTPLIRLGYRHLQATQFVGVIRLGEITLQILPKIDFEGNAEAESGSTPYQAAALSATRNLLYLLSYTQDLQIREQDVAPLLAQRSDWFELLTRLLALNLHALMQRGIEHAYVGLEETIPLIRGRWQLARQLTSRPHVRHTFDVAYDEFLADTPLNRVFRFVVDHLLQRTQDSANRRLLHDLHGWLAGATLLAEIRPVHLAQVHFSRLNERFRPAFNLARLFIENSTFQLAAGQQTTFAFVFDMNRLFEEFIARFITRYRQHILPEAWQDARISAQLQDQAIYLAERVPNRQPFFRLMPDLLFSRPSGRPLLILDTKYKQLDPQQRRLGIAETDMYQMLAYATRLDCPRVLLLYPESARSARLHTQFETLGQPNVMAIATINLRQRLDSPAGLIQELKECFDPFSQLVLTEVY